MLIRDLNFRVCLVAVKDYLAYKLLVYVLIRNTVLHFCGMLLNRLSSGAYSVFFFNTFVNLFDANILKFLSMTGESHQSRFFPQTYKITHLAGEGTTALEGVYQNVDIL